MTRQVMIGQVAVGGGAPVSVQTMAKAAPNDLKTIVAQLRAAKRAGCDIARVAVPEVRATEAIGLIKEKTGLPIVADVHFDWRIAVAAVRAGADGLRVNPGNLGGKDALKRVVEAAREREIPIRVGVNAGSLPKEGGRPAAATAQNLVRAAQHMCEQILELGYDKIKVSLKAFDLALTVEANQRFSASSDLPLHLGLTEAGTTLAGTARSAAALGILLHQGIGDTIRISLSSSPVDEVRAGVALLRSLGLRRGPQVISCPTCGRTAAPVEATARRVERLLEQCGLSLTVAVMGCEVNGPGEARAADLGIAFGPRGQGLIFERGRVLHTAPNEKLGGLLMKLIERQAAQKEK